MSNNGSTIAIFSSLATDEDMAELVKLYVDEMPDRIASLRQAANTGDHELLCRLAHQIKGSSGGYGFDQLRDPAARLEIKAREASSPQEILEALEALVDFCQRAQPGVP